MSEKIIPIFAMTVSQFAHYAKTANEYETQILKNNDFKGQAKKICFIHNNTEIDKVFYGLGDGFDPQSLGHLSRNLPSGTYEIANVENDEDIAKAILFFHLGTYYYDKFKKSPRKNIILIPPAIIAIEEILNIVDAIKMGRDLVNAPANVLNATELRNVAIEIANQYGATAETIIGDDLNEQNYPLIYNVGKASEHEPSLVILRKPKANAPKIAIIGKGVVFDTGGLNIKTGNFMGLMKKDMGGAACALSLFQILAQCDLNIDINVYLPIVENSISSNAMRPSDIVISRKGLSIEIDNTDAEGRLILADALTRASEDKMDLIIDFATLTGAARVALGPELPPFYTNSTKLAQEIKDAASKTYDPVWEMPLWKNYNEDLESQIADLKNGGGQFAGSITAALFLQKFVDCHEWVHFDVYCHNPKERAAFPQGGEIQAVRAVLHMLEKRYS